jgi:hypothetical protein
MPLTYYLNITFKTLNTSIFKNGDNNMNRKIALNLLFNILSIIILSSPLLAANLYVATNGADSGNCQSRDCATISYAIGQASSGDSIKIKPGSYDLRDESGGKIQIDKAVEVTAYDTDNRPILNGNGAQLYCVNISAANATLSYVIVDMNDRSDSWNHENIRVEGTGVTVDHVDTRNGHVGLFISGGKNVTISNTKSYNHGTRNKNPESGKGFAFYSSRYGTRPSNWDEKTLFLNCEGYNVGEDFWQGKSDSQNPPTTWVQYVEFDGCIARDNDEDGFDFKGTRYIRIHNSEIYNNAGDGVVSHNSTSSPQADYIEIYNNKIYNNGWWGIYATTDCDNWKIYNNLIYGNANSSEYETYNTYGIQVKENTQVYHNTLYNNGTYGRSKNHGGYRGSDSAVFKNNIAYQNGTGTHGNIYSGSGGAISNNYVYPTSPGKTGSNAITVSDPKIKDPANGNFELEEGSPLIDAGLDVGIGEDYSGNSRLATSGFTIGAYEYDSGGVMESELQAPKGLRVIQ